MVDLAPDQDDEAWIEAQLERDLQALDNAGLGDSDLESNGSEAGAVGEGDSTGVLDYGRRLPWVRAHPREEEHEEKSKRAAGAEGGEATESGNDNVDSLIAEAALPSSFQELLRCLREEQAEASDLADAHGEDIERLAQDLDKLAKPSMTELGVGADGESGRPRNSDGFGELSAEDQVLLAEACEEIGVAGPHRGPSGIKAQDRDAAGMEAEHAKDSVPTGEDNDELELEEAASASQDASRDVDVGTEEYSPTLSPEYEAEQRRIAEERLAQLAKLEKERQELDSQLATEAEEARLREEDGRRAWEAQLEEQQQREEAEQAKRIAELERERQALREQCRLKEEARRHDERRSREEAAMQSEELSLRDFYSEERSVQRRERRFFGAEDRASARWREAERLALMDAEKHREMSERNDMSRADAAAARLADAEKQAVETVRMVQADGESARLRAELRRLVDLSRLAAADAEAARWRDAAREAQEREHMNAEDALAELLRQCGIVSVCLVESRTANRSRRTRASTIAAAAAAAAIGSTICEPSFGSTGAHSGDVGTLGSKSSVGDSTGLDSGAALAKLKGVRRPSSSTCRVAPDMVKVGVAATAPRVTQANIVREQDPPSCSAAAPSTTCFDPWRLAPAMSSLPASGADPPSQAQLQACGGQLSRQERSNIEMPPSAKMQPPASPQIGGSICVCGGALCNALSTCVARMRASPDSGLGRLPTFEVERPPQRAGGQLAQTRQEAALPMSIAELGVDETDLALGELGIGGDPSRTARLDVKMADLEVIPDEIGSFVALRVLNLAGNRLAGLLDLRALGRLPLLEELSVCQQQGSLERLEGLGALERLSVLRATQNSIKEVDAPLRALRHAEFGCNRLTTVRLRAPHLARLDLYRNELTSMAFLEQLPSLTHLDLGRNRLTEVDVRLSEWTPLLLKLFLHENRLARLPDFRLPLLTDLGVDNNELRNLGPLGFLPSLERLTAEHNHIEVLGTPIAASPLLQTLRVSFNQLANSESLGPVFLHARLRSLQLNDNPAVAEMMEAGTYQKWVLRRALQLEELDNDVVGQEERLAAAAASATGSITLAYDIAGAFATLGADTTTAAAGDSERKPDSLARMPAADGGLLGLVKLTEVEHGLTLFGDEEEGTESAACQREGPAANALIRAGTANIGGCALGGLDTLALQRSALHGRWQAACGATTFAAVVCVASADRGGANSVARASVSTRSRDGVMVDGCGGCGSCALTLWCESATAARGTLLVALARDERRAALTPWICPGGIGDCGSRDVVMSLRRRHEFWGNFLGMCAAQYKALATGRFSNGVGAALRSAAFESAGAEWSKCTRVSRLQARRRGVLARRRCWRLRVQKRCSLLTEHQLLGVVRIQALFRSYATRRRRIARGDPLPGIKRRDRANGAATMLQARFRGSRVRAKLKWARGMAKLADDELEDCPHIDVDGLLGDMSLAVERANPFAGFCPMATVAPPRLHSLLGLQSVSSSAASCSSPPAASFPDPVAATRPRDAWNTPPAIAQASWQPAAGAGDVASSSAPSPSSSRGGAAAGGAFGDLRCASLASSMASSAVMEAEGLPSSRRGGHAEQPRHDEPPPDDAETAYLIARQRIQKQGRSKTGKPPLAGTKPGASTGLRGGISGGGAPLARGFSQPPGNAKAGAKSAGLVKAQDAINEARAIARAQEERERTQPAEAFPEVRRPASTEETREFRSGEPNKLLMRTSRSWQSPPASPSIRPSSSGGRAASPRRR